jgi:drug/metabolite transporter (DMT)-like permease
MNDIREAMGMREWAMLVTLSVLWGGSFFFNEAILEGFQPLTSAALRVTLAAIVLWLIAAALGYRIPLNRESWCRFLVIGMLNNAIPFSLILWAQSHIASGLASMLNATTPLFTVITAHMFLHDEPASPRKLAGVVIGLAGVVMMVGLDVGSNGNSVAAQLAILVAAFCYTVAGVYGRSFSGMPPIVTAVGQLIGSTTILLPVALLVDRPGNVASAGLAAWWAVAALAILSTALAYCLYFTILKATGATNLLLVTFLVPVSAIFLGVMFLNETLVATDLAGFAAVATGLLLIDGRALRLLDRGRRSP